jgi:hypothetical protein
MITPTNGVLGFPLGYGGGEKINGHYLSLKTTLISKAKSAVRATGSNSVGG